MFFFILFYQESQYRRQEGRDEARRTDLNHFSYCFTKEINTGGWKWRGKKHGEDLDGFPYCFIQEMNTGGRRRTREELNGFSYCCLRKSIQEAEGGGGEGG